MKLIKIKKMNKNLKFITCITCLILLYVFLSCSVNNQNVLQRIYWVNSYKVDCEGVGAMMCLQISKTDSLPSNDKWDYFYTQIEGFNYESGFIYKLLVEEQNLNVGDIPADASSIKYKLVKMLKKYKVNSNVKGEWVLVSLSGVSLIDVDEQVSMLLDTDKMKITGSDSCNRIMGEIEKLTNNEIKFSKLASTRMMCRDMSLADAFHLRIGNTSSFKIINNSMYLYNSKGKELLSFKKKK